MTDANKKLTNDFIYTANLLEALSVPFDLWDAFESGVIDASGKILIPLNKRSVYQKSTLSIFDAVVLSLYRLANDSNIEKPETIERIKFLTLALGYIVQREPAVVVPAVEVFLKRLTGKQIKLNITDSSAFDMFTGIKLLSEEDGGGNLSLSVGAGIGGPGGNPGDGSALAGPEGMSIFTKHRKRRYKPAKAKTGKSYKTPTLITEEIQTDDAPWLQMNFHDFDQPPNSPWRKLAQKEKYSEAADMIMQYLDHAKKLDGYEKSNLVWHAGQMFAYAGKTSNAIKAMQQSMTFNNDQYWEDYANGTIAFLKNDKKKLESIINSWLFQQGDTNHGILKGLLANFGKSYKDAY